jgi:hypothetical protein
MLKCPVCGKDTVVTNSRGQDDGSIKRRRECQKCKKRFSTREYTANTFAEERFLASNKTSRPVVSGGRVGMHHSKRKKSYRNHRKSNGKDILEDLKNLRNEWQKLIRDFDGRWVGDDEKIMMATYRFCLKDLKWLLKRHT